MYQSAGAAGLRSRRAAACAGAVLAATAFGLLSAGPAAATASADPADCTPSALAIGPNSVSEGTALSACGADGVTYAQSVGGVLVRSFGWRVTKEVVGEAAKAARVTEEDRAGTAEFGFKVVVTPQPAEVVSHRMTGMVILNNPTAKDFEVDLVPAESLGANASCTYDVPEESRAVGDAGRVIVPGNASNDDAGGAPALFAPSSEGRLAVGVQCDVGVDVAIDGTAPSQIDWAAVSQQVEVGTQSASVELGGNFWQMEFKNGLVTVMDDFGIAGEETVIGTCLWNDAGEPCEFEYVHEYPGPDPEGTEPTAGYPGSAWLAELPEVKDVQLVAVQGQLAAMANGEAAAAGIDCHDDPNHTLCTTGATVGGFSLTNPVVLVASSVLAGGTVLLIGTMRNRKLSDALVPVSADAARAVPPAPSAQPVAAPIAVVMPQPLARVSPVVPMQPVQPVQPVQPIQPLTPAVASVVAAATPTVAPVTAAAMPAVPVQPLSTVDTATVPTTFPARRSARHQAPEE